MKIVYPACPVCESVSIEPVLQAKDYTVSGELYHIWQCSKCSLRFTQSVPDQSEISKYYQSEAYISHSESKKGFVNSLYHFVRNRTLRSKRKLVEKATALEEGTLLDLGAGTGAFAAEMENSGWTVKGLEPDEVARKNASQLHNITLDPPDELFYMPSVSMDAITMWHVLEHVHDLNGYMQRLKHIIKPSGKIFIAVPNYTSFDAEIYKSYWAAYDVPRHLYHFSPKAMQTLLSKHGLVLKETLPMWYDSYYVSMLSQRYKTGTGNIFVAFWNGMVSNLKAMMNKERCSSLIYVIGKK